ncbi:MAG TPA: hypothetical protein PLP11_07415 [Bacteroidales bacterium]|nr:hypothetical protein [Bacteroidales bacterium]
MIVKALDGQSYFDIAVVHTGLATNAANIALANSAIVSDAPTGDVIVPDDIVINQTVIDFYKKQLIKPATYENV